MNELRRALGRKDRTESPRPLEIWATPVTAVWFCPWKATEWIMPWDNLNGIAFRTQGEEDQLVFLFNGFQVTVNGSNLRKVLDDSEKGKLPSNVMCMRALSEIYRKDFGPDEVFISKIEVQSNESDMQNETEPTSG